MKPALADPGYGSLERQVLDLGHRASRGGPITTLPDGSLIWATTEPEAPYLAKAMWAISRLALRRSTDGGRSWGQPHVFMQGTKEYSLLSHTLRVTAAGSLIHLFVRYSGYDYDSGLPEKSLCEVFTHRSHDGGRTWSEPKKVPTAERYNGDVLSCEQLRDGRLIYPFCYLSNVKAQFRTSAMYSDDDGVTWKRSVTTLEAGGGGFESGASEPSAVELPDGLLWMLIRAQTGFTWESFSTDRGVTWTVAKPSHLPASNAPTVGLRLRSGDIALAWNNHVQSNYARQSLLLGITSDGKTFRGLREIDFTDFQNNPSDPLLHVTYPYLAETRDGAIAVTYNKGNWSRHNRPALAIVQPLYILARQELVDFRLGRVGWHTTNPGPSPVAVERYVTTSAGDLWMELEQPANAKTPTGISRNLPLVADGTVRITMSVVRPEAFVTFGDSLIDPANTAEGVLRLRFAGGKMMVGAGVAEEVSRNYRNKTTYAYTGRVVKTETAYPKPVPPDGQLELVVEYRASEQKATIRMNGGPAMVLATTKVFGLTSIGFANASGGAVRIGSIRTDLA
ncbi:MAG: sialidase family protein [Bryobacteraceae bacterium]